MAALVRLVGRLVLAEAEVAVGAEELDRAELVLQFGAQLFHRFAHMALVRLPVGGPVGLAVVGLQALVELERLTGEAAERHGSPLSSGDSVSGDSVAGGSVAGDDPVGQAADVLDG